MNSKAQVKEKLGQVVQNSRLPFAVCRLPFAVNVTLNLSNDCHCLGEMAVRMGNVVMVGCFLKAGFHQRPGQSRNQKRST